VGAAATGLRGAKMIDRLLLLGDVDRLCGQFATALHNAEWQIYAAIALVLVLSVLLFPPKNDPDQI
jgi:hypothetical protein